MLLDSTYHRGKVTPLDRIPRFRCETSIGTISPPVLFLLTSEKGDFVKWVFASVCVNANELCLSVVQLSVGTQWR